MPDVQMAEPTGSDLPINGAELLDEIHGEIIDHLDLPDGAAEAIALYVLFSHSINAFRHNPRLLFTSPVPGCGKTTALCLLELMVPRGELVSDITPAVIFRLIEDQKPTLLIDEAEMHVNSKREFRSIVNSGHHIQGAHVYRNEQGPDGAWIPTKFSTWTPMVIAMIGEANATLKSRSIIIPLQKSSGQRILKQVGPATLERLGEIGKTATTWASQKKQDLASFVPSIPDFLTNRAADNWRPLIAIAECAGGEWPVVALRAAALLSAHDVAEDTDTGVLLLVDLKDIFWHEGKEKLPSALICEALSAREDRPWKEFKAGRAITTSQLAKILRPFGIRPGGIRVGRATLRGYHRDDFDDAFARYLPVPSATPQHDREFNDLVDHDVATRSATPRGKPTTLVECGGQDPAVADEVADAEAGKPSDSGQCCDVADGGDENATNGAIDMDAIINKPMYMRFLPETETWIEFDDDDE